MPEAKDLILFTFSPVQAFITASRRTQDLAAASLILSSLASRGLAYIEKEAALSPIFPLHSTSASARQLPNRMVFLSPPDQGGEYAKKLDEQVRDEWLKIAGAVKDYLAKLVSSDRWQNQWDQQVAEWLETYWVAVKWDGRNESYKDAFKTLNLAIDARNRVWVVDGGNRRIQVFSPEGDRITVFPAENRDIFVNPEGIAVSPDGHILVVDTGRKSIFLGRFREKSDRPETGKKKE